MDRTSGSIVVMLVGVLAACNTGSGGEVPREDSTHERRPGNHANQEISRTPGMALEWTFDPDSQEAVVVEQLVRALGESRTSPSVGASGIIHRFNSGQSPGRYLLMTYLESDDALSEPDAVLFMLRKEEPQFSAHLTIGRWGLGTWGPLEISDYDEDSMPDVAFCDWPSDEVDRGQLKVAGITEVSWYWISDPVGDLPECTR